MRDPIISGILNIIELFTSLFRINSFGINPVSGGIPANDNSSIEAIIIKYLGGLCMCHKSYTLYLFIILNKINNGSVTRVYIRK